METNEGLLGSGSGEVRLDAPSRETTGDASGSAGKPAVTKRETVYGYEKMFSPENQGHPALEGLDTPDKLAKSYIELKSKIGKSLVPPGEDATEEDRYEFLRKAGIQTRPKSQDEYAFEDPPGLPPEDMGWFKAAAYRSGLSQEAANKLQAEYRLGQRRAAEEQGKKAASRMLEEERRLELEWGNQSASKKELANRTLQAFISGDKEMVDFLKELRWNGLPATTHPHMRKLFARIGETTTENASPRVSGQNPAAESAGKRYPGLERLS